MEVLYAIVAIYKHYREKVLDTRDNLLDVVDRIRGIEQEIAPPEMPFKFGRVVRGHDGGADYEYVEWDNDQSKPAEF